MDNYKGIELHLHYILQQEGVIKWMPRCIMNVKSSFSFLSMC